MYADFVLMGHSTQKNCKLMVDFYYVWKHENWAGGMCLVNVEQTMGW